MANLSTLQQEFVKEQTEVIVTCPKNLQPLYCETSPEGELNIVGGSFDINKDNEDEDMIPVAPKAKKGFTISPLKLYTRNINSPDAKKFRDKKGVKSFNLLSDKIEPRTKTIVIASIIVGWDNMITDVDGRTVSLDFSKANVFKLLEEYPAAEDMVILSLIKLKKMKSLS